jgi:hypothetical protein
VDVGRGVAVDVRVNVGVGVNVGVCVFVSVGVDVNVVVKTDVAEAMTVGEISTLTSVAVGAFAGALVKKSLRTDARIGNASSSKMMSAMAARRERLVISRTPFGRR